jgi:zinc protease
MVLMVLVLILANEITIEDIKEFYNKNFSPSVTNFHIVGNVTQSEVMDILTGITSNWEAKEVEFPNYEVPPVPQEPEVYFVDVPRAKQSVILIGRLTVDGNDDVYNQIMIANDRLGGGSSGRLFQVLREDKGFTYGAYSFTRRKAIDPGFFQAYSSVRSNVTKESLDTFKEVIGQYGETYTEDDLSKTQNSMIKKNTQRFETLFDLVGILQDISTYDLPMDYIDQEQTAVTNMTVDKIVATTNEYMDLNNMIYVIVGDKETQFDRLKVEGPGNPVLVDKYGNPVDMNM